MMQRSIVLWSPRILGVVMSLVVGAFAMDALHEGAAAFLLHVAPGVMLLLVVIASWRWQWVGGVVFSTLGVLYAARVWPRVDWILVISAPLLVVGILFLLNWRYQRTEPHMTP